ncbi:ribonucleoprotein RB97D isoform X1 [Drosophila kikkawai]|uniref:Ribonucleoprotein RB97D isoform X1 n=1 Tax=Drosophila kikkawai TaxID=30033 RepID=A0A6P4IFV7_DROKI|nr:RNA-binding protein Musashi homolog 2 isoform X2 [Drosophila kikkawai]
MEVNCVSPETCVQRELNGGLSAVENELTNLLATANNPSTNEPNKEESGPEHLRKIFVGGLSTQTTAGTVRKFFEQFGAVADAVVMRDPVTNHSRGFGFVTFAEPQSVENVQGARPHCIDNKNVETKRALPRHDFVKGGSGGGRAMSAASCGMGMLGTKTSKIFLGGLKDCHDEKSICEYFSQFGKIAHVKLLLDRETGRMRGFGFLEFENPVCAERALAQSKHSINLHTVEVKKSTQKPDTVNRVRFAVGGAARAGYIPPQPATLDCFGYNNNYNPYLAQSVLPPSAYINGWAAYVTPEMSQFDMYAASPQRYPPAMRPPSQPIPSAFGPESWSAYPKSGKFPPQGWAPGTVGEWQPKAGYKHAQTSTSDHIISGLSLDGKIELGAGGDGNEGLAGGKAVADVSIGAEVTDKKWPTENYKIFKPAQSLGQNGGTPPTYGI